MRVAPLTAFGLLCALGASTSTAQAPLREGYETIGEGLTASTTTGQIEFGWRLFTIYTMDEACRRSRADRVVQLRAQVPRVSTRIGQPFSPTRLAIVAFDASGHLVPRVPIGVESNAPADFFDARLHDASGVGPSVPLGTGPLLPLTVGTVNFRARTLCRGSAADVLVEFRVTR